MHSSGDGHTDCFHLLAVIKNAVMNTVHKFLCGADFITLGHITRSGTAGHMIN